jgi:hypothetical protein
MPTIKALKEKQLMARAKWKPCVQWWIIAMGHLAIQCYLKKKVI